MFNSRIQSYHANDRASERNIKGYQGIAVDVCYKLNNGKMRRADTLVVLGVDHTDSVNPYIVAVIRFSHITFAYRIISTFRTNKISASKHRVDQVINLA